MLLYYNQIVLFLSLKFLLYFELLLRLEWFIDFWDVGSSNDFLLEEFSSSRSQYIDLDSDFLSSQGLYIKGNFCLLKGILFVKQDNVQNGLIE